MAQAEAQRPCAANPCTNVGDTCTEQCVAGGYICTCEHPSMYGRECQNQDGVYEEWSQWSGCFMDCEGTARNRTRDCTNPSPLGAGSDCSADGAGTEIEQCSSVYADCASSFPYEFESQSQSCMGFDDELSLSIDDCVVRCQNDVACNGIAYKGSLPLPCRFFTEECSSPVTIREMFHYSKVTHTGCTGYTTRSPGVKKAWIDPDGDGPNDPFVVYCDLTTTPISALISPVGHINQQLTLDLVAPTFQYDIEYAITDNEIQSVITASNGACMQHVDYQCFSSKLGYDGNLKMLTQAEWIGNDGSTQHHYWPGGRPTTGCKCGANMNCQAQGYHCNCDIGDNYPRTDSGDLAEPENLPITAIIATDLEGTADVSVDINAMRCFVSSQCNTPINQITYHLLNIPNNVNGAFLWTTTFIKESASSKIRIRLSLTLRAGAHSVGCSSWKISLTNSDCNGMSSTTPLLAMMHSPEAVTGLDYLDHHMTYYLDAICDDNLNAGIQTVKLHSLGDCAAHGITQVGAAATGWGEAEALMIEEVDVIDVDAATGEEIPCPQCAVFNMRSIINTADVTVTTGVAYRYSNTDEILKSHLFTIKQSQ